VAGSQNVRCGSQGGHRRSADSKYETRVEWSKRDLTLSSIGLVTRSSFTAGFFTQLDFFHPAVRAWFDQSFPLSTASPLKINSNPWRLNLDWRWYQRGLELGCMFSIDPDAHSTSEIDHVRWGVSLARKGGIPPGPILNSLGLKDFTAFLHDRKQRLASGPKTRRSPARSEART
jgi:hypothetical protein